jgi:hypothetical protein
VSSPKNSGSEGRCQIYFARLLSQTPFPWSAKGPELPGDDLTTGEYEAEEEPSTPRRQVGWEKRWATYLVHRTFAPHLQNPGTSDRDVYQLVRNAIYSRLLSDALGKRNAVVLSLVSKLQWDLFPNMERQYAHFRTRCSPFVTVTGPIFWEDVASQVSPPLGDCIRTALARVAAWVSDYITSTIRKLRSGVEEVSRQAHAGLCHFPRELIGEHLHDLVTCFAAPRATDIRGTVIDRLVEARGDAIPALVAGLEHGNPLVRIGCLEVLENVGREDRDRSVHALDAFLRKPRLSLMRRFLCHEAIPRSRTRLRGIVSRWGSSVSRTCESPDALRRVVRLACNPLRDDSVVLNRGTGSPRRGAPW